MGKFYLAMLLLIICINLHAQNIGINSTGSLPDPSAILDISSSDKGLLLPRVSLNDVNDKITISEPATWLVVLNINDTIIGGKGSGLYFNSGTPLSPVWVKLLTEQPSVATAWGLTGNALTDTAQNYIGTQDNKAILFKVNGQKAGLIDIPANRNIFLGIGAGKNNTAKNNTFIGESSGLSNTSGEFNISLGVSALSGNFSGNYNVAIGDSALASFNLNSGNVGIGSKVLSKATSAGQFNTAIGFEAMRGALSGVISGNRNTALGYRALSGYTTGGFNSAIGPNSLGSNTTGSYNHAIGDSALFFNLSGSRNMALGKNALSLNTNGAGNVAIGHMALSNANRSGNTAIGDSALVSYNGINPNTVVGARAMRSYVATGTGSGYNTALGRDAMYRLTTGNSNTAIGDSVGYFMTKAVDNVLIGRNAGKGMVSGSRNIAIGNYALERQTYTPTFEVAYNSNNIALGYWAMNKTNASDTLLPDGRSNVAIGSFAMLNNTFGYRNTVAGDSVLLNNTTGYNNAAFGYLSMSDNTSGFNNTAMGVQSSVGANASNSGAFGFQAAATGSNSINLGNSSVVNIKGQVNFAAISDGRFKNDIREGVPGLPFILGLRPVTYHYDIRSLHRHLRPFDDTEADVSAGQDQIVYSGFIAQEVESLSDSIGYSFSGVVPPRSENDTYAIRYAEFVVPLVKAVQEQQAIIEQQKDSIQSLEALLRDLQYRVCSLENMIRGK